MNSAFSFHVLQSAFSIHSQGIENVATLDSSIILNGPGNIRHRKYKNHLTTIQWQVRLGIICLGIIILLVSCRIFYVQIR
jgi:hypothetical protein